MNHPASPPAPRRNARQAALDAAMALAEARTQGTACGCICIGGSVEAAKLASLFGAAHLLTVDDSAQAHARIRSVCARAVASVSRRRSRTEPLASNASP